MAVTKTPFIPVYELVSATKSGFKFANTDASSISINIILVFGCQNILFSDLLIQGDVAFDHRMLLKENVQHLKVFFILLLNKKFDDTLM